MSNSPPPETIRQCVRKLKKQLGAIPAIQTLHLAYANFHMTAQTLFCI